MSDPSDPVAAVAWLRTPRAIRERCAIIRQAAEADSLEHFALRGDRLDAVADYVAETVRQAYPTFEIPYHSRWRHFDVGGRDRWAGLTARLGQVPAQEVARIRFDLAVTSVLLDAGAGEAWSYREPATGETYARSEGLAVASFDLFAGGALSSDPERPLRADAEGLTAMTEDQLAAVFQAGPDNPLVGRDGRTRLLNRLGEILQQSLELFGSPLARVGYLYDYLAGRAVNGQLPASEILDAVLHGLGPIWPGRIELGGVNLGDVWRHPAVRTGDLTDGLVPFHKLSQWLSYSLVEPLEEVGIEVTGLDELTGLPEYRNGGLFVDLGVLVPKHDGVLTEPHEVGSEVVVEWRALTVALLDEVAPLVRARLGLDEAALPLAKVLEGGTWSAGRGIARARRADGSPPIKVASDGTVF